MTSMPASRRARAMIFAPRSWPSSPGLATTTRILRAVGLGAAMRPAGTPRGGPGRARIMPSAPVRGPIRLADPQCEVHTGVDRADDPVRPPPGHLLAEGALGLRAGAELHRPAPDGHVVRGPATPHEPDGGVALDGHRLRREEVVAQRDRLRCAEGRDGGEPCTDQGDGCEDGDEPLHGWMHSS